jgi:thymidylate kinase
MSSIKENLLVTIEGIDGTGKTSLVESLKNLQPTWKFTKEPGNLELPQCIELREIALGYSSLSPMTRELVLYADAHENKQWIETQKGVIISDRGIWSHYAYVSGYRGINKISYEDYLLALDVIPQVCREPDLIVHLEGTTDLMRSRLQGKKADAIESLPNEYFTYVRAMYSRLISQRKALAKPLLCLEALDSIDTNVKRVIEWVKDYEAHLAPAESPPRIQNA